MHLRSSVLIAAFLVSCGDSVPRPMQTVRKSVDAPPNTLVSAEITMAGGELHVHVGDAGPAADAEFQFDWEPMRPELAFDASAAPPRVLITQPNLPDRPQRSHNLWKIALDGSRVTHLAVTQGVGAAEITVQGPTVESINLRLGTGAMTVDLTRVARSLTGHIEQNNGRLVLKLPRHLGVKVHRKLMAGYATLDGVEQNDATWTSKDYESAPIKVDLDVLVFAGELEMTTE